jgi:hypothetical protein
MSRHLPLVTAEEMAAIDAETIASGISGIVLVERAGKGVWAIAAERYHAGSQTAAVFLCGKGNNGADCGPGGKGRRARSGCLLVRQRRGRFWRGASSSPGRS